MAMEYPEVRKELDAIEGAMEQYAQLNAVEPSADLQGKILDRIKNQQPSPAPPLPVAGKRIRPMFFLAAAAVLAALVWGWAQMQKVDNQRLEIEKLQAQLDTLEADCNQRISRLQETEQAFAFIKDGNTVPVQMKGTDKAPDAVATVFWNADLRKSYLDITALPGVPNGKQYQLWAIVDGAPVDMGVFDLTGSQNTLVEVTFIENPQAFAITLEQLGGSPSPTLEEMVVIGNTS